MLASAKSVFLDQVMGKDTAEIETCFASGAWKATYVLAGSALEQILVAHFLRRTGSVQASASIKLGDLIAAAYEASEGFGRERAERAAKLLAVLVEVALRWYWPTRSDRLRSVPSLYAEATSRTAMYSVPPMRYDFNVIMGNALTKAVKGVAAAEFNSDKGGRLELTFTSVSQSFMQATLRTSGLPLTDMKPCLVVKPFWFGIFSAGRAAWDSAFSPAR